MTQKEQDHTWLSLYANSRHTWQKIPSPPGTTGNNSTSYTRPLGLVELSFHLDGTLFGGRADMDTLLTLEISHKLSQQELRTRIALAWTCLRFEHVLLMSRAEEVDGEINFVIDVPGSEKMSVEEIVQDVQNQIIWIEESYPISISTEDLYMHARNVSRIIDPLKCLSKLHVLPLTRLPNGHFKLTFLIVMAHQISDGMSGYTWSSHFIRLLNTPAAQLQSKIATITENHASYIEPKLPPAQEDLYPKPWGANRARKRWFWAIIRVLRHVRRPLPETFTNPLRRTKRLEKPVELPRMFDKIFDYEGVNQPPLSSAVIIAILSPQASKKLITLCKSIRASVGAGCFALAGMAMMDIYERQHLSSSLHANETKMESLPLPFTASFPLNPRAFFNHTAPPDSCMLSFSEGIVMPFLPSSLPVEDRFKLIARRANTELKMYQKRKRITTAGAAFDPHNPTRLLATGYLSSLERVFAKCPPSLNVYHQLSQNPQGTLPANVGKYNATCGVSSIGSIATLFDEGRYNLDLTAEDRDFAADYRNVKMGIRARDNEFLVGSSTDNKGRVTFKVSYDLCGIDEALAEDWKQVMIGLLEDKEERARL